MSRLFFSSRRRHTRCSRDWSSDVCSSDLLLYAGAGGNIELAFGRLGSRIGRDPRPPVPAVGGAPEAVSAARHAPSAPAGTRLGAGAVAGRTARPAEKRTLAGQGRGPWLHGNPLRRGGAAARSRKKGGGWAEARAGPAVWR